MREIKVQCDCGQKYKFEVEPVNGQMPYSITCPVCGLDGTNKANALLLTPAVPVSVQPTPVAIVPAEVRSESVSPPASSPPPPPPTRMRVPTGPPSPPPPPAPVAARAVEPAPAAASAGDRPRLRINSGAHSAPAAPAPAVAEAPNPPAPRRIAGVARPAAAAGPTSGRRPSFALGILGAFLGAVIGAIIYFGIFSYSGFRLGLMGIGVGLLAGLGARLLGKEGSNELGVITATLCLVGILGAQYFVALKWWHEDTLEDSEMAASLFKEMADEAKKVVVAVPTGSDQEIRVYLAKSEVEGTSEAPKFAEVTAEDIAEFREELPEIRDLASGKLNFEAWEQNIKDEAAAEEAAKTPEEREEEEGTFKWFFMLLLLNKVNLISMVAGAGLAYKMSTDAPG